MSRCVSGRHEWLDDGSGALCCNGWRRICVKAGEIPADAAPEGRNHLRGVFTGLVNVWIPAKREEASTP